ncbi:uncharacterized protein KZ484_026165 isoform 1-T2 [Pholidichthys leucotaenia]
MDLFLLPASVSAYSQQRTGAHFTVRSANSPAYSLARRLSIRKRETTDEAGERQNFAFESRGRSEWRMVNTPNRSKSLDWKVRGRSPDQKIGADVGRGDISKQALGLEERRTGGEGKVLASVQAFNLKHASNDRNQTCDRLGRGCSVPFRFRSHSGPYSPSSVGAKGGQSILERIEKLYGSAGFSKADDFQTRDFSIPGTSTDSSISPCQNSHERTAGRMFSRRFSSGEQSSAVKETLSTIWTPKDNDKSSIETSLFPGMSTIKDRSAGGQWQCRNLDQIGKNWGNGFMETGTRSLDRERSRSSVAAQIRSARAAGDGIANVQPNTFLDETSVFSNYASRFKEGRATGSEGESTTNREAKLFNGLVRNRAGSLKEKIRREAGDESKENNELGLSTPDEDVFEATPEKTTMKCVERRKLLSLPSTDSVKNKISQFEALTQRSQGLASGQVLLPRRTFSVPTPVTRTCDGVKKSGSAKEIGGRKDKWEGLTERGETCDKPWEKEMGIKQKLCSETPASFGEDGLKLDQKETGRDELLKDVKDNASDDSDKYSGLKNTLELDLNSGALITSRKLGTDETDFCKVSNPEEESNTDETDFSKSASLPCDSSAGIQEEKSSETTQLNSDNNETPTNSPGNSPVMSAITPIATPIADSEDKSTSAFTPADKSQDPNSPPFLHPLATSSHGNLLDLISPDVKTDPAKQKKWALDPESWVAGLKKDFVPWDDDDDDDDEGTQKDEDSNYDSDSGESSVTITSNMSQSDHKSFSVSLSDLCDVAGVGYESENDNDGWQSLGRRSASLSSNVSVLSCVSMLPAEELDKLVEEARGLGDDALQDYSDVQVVVLHKEVGVGLGFSLAGGVDQNKPITVHKVFHSGVAAQEGSIKEGLQVLSINGTTLSGSAHWEALRVLRRAKAREMGVVVLRMGDARDSPKNGVEGYNHRPTQIQGETGQRVSVQLLKNNRDLGFSLEGGEGANLGNRPITVLQIFPGGPVNTVFPGDEVVEIQGKSVLGMRRLDAWKLIRGLPRGPVDVVLRRPLKHLET